MSQVGTSVHPAEQPAEQKSIQPIGREHTQKALELVAVRGRDVIGVRHILPGGTAWIGEVRDSLARIPMKEYGGQPLIVGTVKREEYALFIPPRARARMHGPGMVPRILTGPHKFTLTPGERAFLVLGQIQIRAQVIDVETAERKIGLGASVAGWVGFTTAIYASTLAVCAALAPSNVAHLEHGAMQRLHEQFLSVVPSR